MHPHIRVYVYIQPIHLAVPWKRAFLVFYEPGFIHTVIAFAVSEATINSFSAFMPAILLPLGIYLCIYLFIYMYAYVVCNVLDGCFHVYIF